jgi:iron(II)-dependent oxidoreductase
MAVYLLASATFTLPTPAQDSRYTPVSQQIPPPACLTLKGAWEGGYVPCTDVTHKEWLDDVTHWRAERRIRIGYDGSRYQLPVLQWASRRSSSRR